MEKKQRSGRVNSLGTFAESKITEETEHSDAESKVSDKVI